MGKTTNKYIQEKRRKKKIKNTVLILIILLCLTVLFAFKSEFFSIKEIDLKGNFITNKEVLLEELENLKGTNIITLNIEEISNILKKNPYIESVKVEKELPNKININISERKAGFYFKENDKIYVINNEFIVLEEKDSLDNLNLIEIKNISGNNIEVGKKIIDDERKSKILKNINDILAKNKSEINFDSLDLTDLLDIKFYHKDVEVRVGSDEEMQDKLNKAINILKSDEINITKGVIDVRYKASPTVKIENDDKKNKNTNAEDSSENHTSDKSEDNTEE